MKIIKNWIDQLIWCPSQCYLYIEDRGINYCIYLRWRHNDPWTAEIYRTDVKGKGIYDIPWIKLDVGFFSKKDNLDDLKKTAISAAKRYLNSLT